MKRPAGHQFTLDEVKAMSPAERRENIDALRDQRARLGQAQADERAARRDERVRGSHLARQRARAARSS
ncbi:MAG TPA: hypothetical protein VFU19_11455 [Iamia sp.]|nr:hypothetical protein [Iamia sp.]